MAQQKFNTPLIANGLARNEPTLGAQQGQVATPTLPIIFPPDSYHQTIS